MPPPQPQVSITGSSNSIYSGTAFNMTCTANVANLFVFVTVKMVWKKLFGSTWNTVFNFHANKTSPNSFQSTVELYPVCSSDGGAYSCTATVIAEDYSTTEVAYFALSVTGKILLIACFVF